MGKPRSIAVIDVGATNAKVVQFTPDLVPVASRSLPVKHTAGPPYPALDVDAVLKFAVDAIRTLDADLPVDEIVPCTHGSALALVDGDGALALPVMAYMADAPDTIAADYAQVAPAFDETLCPTLPAALTLGRQLFWQSGHWPDEFQRVRHIMCYAQYLSFRLTGVAASEVSALGAQTHLWPPREGAFSSLAKAEGWDRLFPPFRSAGDVLGVADRLHLDGAGRVRCGVHDSNANLLGYQRATPFVLLSTGTWAIAFDTGASLDGLDGAYDQVSNTTVAGDPVACARFMAGEEYRLIAGDSVADMKTVEALIDRDVMARPSFTDAGGPVPNCGGLGRIEGECHSAERGSLAALYTAEMCALMIDRLGATREVIVDGPFARNRVFMALLAQLLQVRRVFTSGEEQGTAAGAARLGLADPDSAHTPDIAAVIPATIPNLAEYDQKWRAGILA